MKKLFITITLLSPVGCFAETSGAENVIAFAPIVFYILIMALTVIKLRKDGTKLSDLFAEKETSVASTTPTPQQEPVPTPPANTTPGQSVSRFIAFVTGLVALAIGVSLCTFYMYCYFVNPNKTVDLSNLTNVIWGLGIGVIPYGFNKTSSALKSN
ncbi:hypothetical protein [uncultured Mucilaginibacter sp.]|uniref:hypothetical protein n=1 Tax=uncultured Mucilaginibacter sp. TaxID=797541 RepID=UPI0025DCC343|nr:hypothetical protein [uncultured Mucilaginibacter sp.]